MSKLTFRGDATDVSQITLLPNPPAEFIGEIKVGISNKSLTFDQWDKELIAKEWNGSGIPEFAGAVATVTEDGVLLTAATPGVPFRVWISYGGSSAFNEVLIFTKGNYSDNVTGTMDLTFKGETVSVNYNVDAAALKTALETLTVIDPGDVLTENIVPIIPAGAGLPYQPYTQIKLTWSGQYAGGPVSDLTIDGSALRGGTADVVVTKVRDYRDGQNEIQRIVLGGAPTGGTILYDLEGTSIGPVNYNDNQAAYQTAFDTGLGAGEATVTARSGTGEVGPLQTETFVVDSDNDTGYSHDSAIGNFTKVANAPVVIGNEQEIDGDAVTLFPITAFLLLSTDGSLPGNLEIDRAVLNLSVQSASVGARVDVKIRAVDVANPTQIADGDFTDFSTRALTTASVTWTASQSMTGGVIQPPSLDAIIQELIDTHGAITDVMLYLETQVGSIGKITYYDLSTGYIGGQEPRLSVDYRDGITGADVFDVEFIGSNVQKSLPLMTADISSLLPQRQNTIYRIETTNDTGAHPATPGILQLFDGANSLFSEGTTEAPVLFSEAVVEILDQHFGAENYSMVVDADDVFGRVEFELIEDLSGANTVSDDLVLIWSPISNDVVEGNPQARMELLNEGGGGLGEKRRFLVEANAISGSLALTDGATTSEELPFDLSASQLETALELFVGAGNVTCSGTPTPTGILCDFAVSVGDSPELEIINNLRSQDAVLTESAQQEFSETIDVTETTITLVWKADPTDHFLFSNGSQFATGYITSLNSVFADELRTLYPDALSITETVVIDAGDSATSTIIMRTLEAPNLQVTAGTSDAILHAQADVTSVTTTMSHVGVVSTATIELLGIITGGSWDLQVFASDAGQTINIPVAGVNDGVDTTILHLQSGLNAAIPQATSIVVGGTRQSGYTIEVTAPFAVSFQVSGNGILGSVPEIDFFVLNGYEVAANERQLIVFEDKDVIGGGYLEFTYDGETATYWWATGDIWGGLAQIPALSGNIVVRPFGYDWEIEFTGALAGIDVPMISVSSHLELQDSFAFQNAFWSRTQTGGNGASVVITELQDGSPALGEQGLVRLTNQPHFGTFTLTANGDTTPALPYTATAGLIQISLLSSGGAKQCIGNLTEGVLCSFEAALGAVNLTAANIDLTNARFSSTVYIIGGELTTKELQRSEGKNHFDDPLNWRVVDSGDSRIPDSKDEPIYETGRVACLYGLQQRSDFIVDVDTDEVVLSELADFRVGQKLMVVTDDTLPTGLAADQLYDVASYDRDSRRIVLEQNGVPLTFADLGTGTHTIRLAVDALTHHSRFGAPIGLPYFNPAGYREYLPTALAIGLDPAGQQLLTIGEGGGSSSGRIRLDLGNDQTTVEIHKTGGAIEVGVPALTIKGTNDQNDYEQFDGDVGLGFFEGEEFRFKKLRVHAGSMFYGRIVSSANCEFRNLGGTIDGREGQITGKIASKP